MGNYYHQSIFSAMFLITVFEFPTFKEPKTKRCKTLYLKILPTPSLPFRASIRREIGTKVRIKNGTNKLFAKN